MNLKKRLAGGIFFICNEANGETTKDDKWTQIIDGKIAELAVGDACTGSNPRTIDPETMKKLFECTYYGTEVDF